MTLFKPSSESRYGPLSLARAARQGARSYIDHIRMRGSYAKWLGQQLGSDPISVQLNNSGGTNLILGAAMGYTIKQLLPFVRSMRRHCTSPAILVVSDETLKGQLQGEGVDSVVLKTTTGFCPHPNFSRTSVYRSILQGLSFHFNWIFLLDTRDVLFQGDPFDVAAGDRSSGIHFFKEARDFRFSNSEVNGFWLRQMCGASVAEALLQRDVICGGTVMVSGDCAIAYCTQKLMVGAMIPSEVHRYPGVDQITTNLVGHLGLLPGVKIHSYDSYVATISSRNREYLLLKEDSLVNEVGYQPPIVHQYDKVPEILNWALSTYSMAGYSGSPRITQRP